MNSLPRGWWTAALEMAGGLTNPPADIPASDGAVEHLLTASRIAAAVRTGDERLTRAWDDSFVAAAAAPFLNEWRGLGVTQRIRATAWTVVSAAAVALAGHLAQPGAVGPLGWLLPAFASIVALGAILGADALGRALRGRTA